MHTTPPLLKPVSAREEAVQRRMVDMRDVLGMRHLSNVTVDAKDKPPAPVSTATGKPVS